MERINDDILIIIFEKLDRKSIFNASKVCKSWYNIIATTSTLVSKVTLATSIASWKDTKYLEELNLLTKKLSEFEYRNFKLTSNYYFNPREFLIMKRFLKNGGSIEKLYMNSFSSTLMMSFLDFSAETLTHLIVASSFPDESFRGCIKLPCLEYLKLNSVDSVLNVFRCENLKTLDIVNCRDLDALEAFLENSNYLPKLKKFKTFEFFWHLDDLQKLKFNLDELEVSHFLSIDSNIFERFLLNQSKTLQKLIITESRIRTPVINFVLDNLRNLRCLKISGSLWSLSDIDINLLPKHAKMESIEMKLVSPNIRYFRSSNINSYKDVSKILMKCENLKIFKFEGLVNVSNIVDCTISLPNLKTLKLETIDQYSYWRCFELKTLEKFTLETLDSERLTVTKFLRFLSKIRSIKYLQVDKWLNIEDENIMSMHDVMIFYRILSRCETFRIKNCKIFPLKFLNLLPRMASKKFKLVEIVCDEKKALLEEMKAQFKNEYFQTVFKSLDEETSSDSWENEVENYDDDEDDEHYGIVRSCFRRFMGSLLHPIY